MRKLSKYEKETIINWNEAENLASIYTFNASLKRRLADFSRKYPLLCRLERSTPEGSVTYVLDKSRLSIRLVPPYSEERKQAASEWAKKNGVADGLFCREIDGLFCRSSPDIIVRRRCVLSHKRRGWLQPSPSFRYSRNLALQDELYHPVINNGPAVLVCVDKRLGTGPVNQSRDAG